MCVSVSRIHTHKRVHKDHLWHKLPSSGFLSALSNEMVIKQERARERIVLLDECSDKKNDFSVSKSHDELHHSRLNEIGPLFIFHCSDPILSKPFMKEDTCHAHTRILTHTHTHRQTSPHRYTHTHTHTYTHTQAHTCKSANWIHSRCAHPCRQTQITNVQMRRMHGCQISRHMTLREGLKGNN